MNTSGMKLNGRSNAGLTLTEGVVVLVVTLLLLAFFLPALARSKKRTNRLGCTNNLKQVGLAYRLWSNDHGDEFPFAFPSVDSSLAWANSPQVFRHFQVMSNELVTPKILVCSKDLQRRLPDPDSSGMLGFQKLSNTNLSYFVGLDAREDDPQQILSGDRNITGGTLSNGFLRTLQPTSAAEWTGDIHHFAGNIGLADGSVQPFDTGGLRKHLAAMTNATIRLAIP